MYVCRTCSHFTSRQQESCLLLCRGAVSVDVAYTESLTVMTKGKPITFGLLDTMNGAAQLCSNGGKVTVEGLDGTADLESKGGNIQVRCRPSAQEYLM